METKKRNVIITSADQHVGDFLCHHWLTSLTKNVDLTNTDVVILDYGLTDRMKQEILAVHPAIIEPCVRDGSIVVIRFRDIARFLRKSSYDQVLNCDGGDIIFQSDISDIFVLHPFEYRVVQEGLYLPFHRTGIRYIEKNIEQKIVRMMAHAMHGIKLLNAGVLCAPIDKMLYLCDFILSHVTDIRHSFGNDQILLGYLLYTRGFHSLDSKYNFVLYTNTGGFTIKEGVFYDGKGALIPVVHNTGRAHFFRAVSHFGYGHDRNVLKKGRYHVVRAAIKIWRMADLSYIKQIVAKLKSLQKVFER